MPLSNKQTQTVTAASDADAGGGVFTVIHVTAWQFPAHVEPAPRRARTSVRGSVAEDLGKGRRVDSAVKPGLKLSGVGA